MHVDKLSRSLENSHKRKNKIEGTEKLYLGDRNDITTNNKNHNHRSSKRESCLYKRPVSVQAPAGCAETGREDGRSYLHYLLQVVERRYAFTNCSYFRYKRRLSLAWRIQEYPRTRLSIGERSTFFFYLSYSSPQLLTVAWKLNDLFNIA